MYFRVAQLSREEGAHDDPNAAGGHATKPWRQQVVCTQWHRRRGVRGGTHERWTLALYLPQLPVAQDRDLQAYRGGTTGGGDGVKAGEVVFQK